MTTDARPPLSVVIVTFRSGSTLLAALSALRAAAPLGTELIVVENGGDASSLSAARETWPGARTVMSPTNVGFAAGVNRGLSLATGQLVLLLNPDAEIEPAAIRLMIEAIESLPEAGVVAPRLLDEEGSPVLSGYPFLSPLAVAWIHLQVARLLPYRSIGRYRRQVLDPDATAPIEVDWAQGACLLVDAKALTASGGFDEDFFLFAEEIDLAFRMKQNGWCTYLVPGARVRHAEGTSSRQVVPLKLASHYLSMVVYFAKHHTRTEQVFVRAILLLDLALRAIYRAIGVVRGTPDDAQLRLVTYLRIAPLMFLPSSRVIRAWHAMGHDFD